MFLPCRDTLSGDPVLCVPSVFPELTTRRVFTSELVHGETVDNHSGFSQEERNKASRRDTGGGGGGVVACTGLHNIRNSLVHVLGYSRSV